MRSVLFRQTKLGSVPFSPGTRCPHPSKISATSPRPCAAQDLYLSLPNFTANSQKTLLGPKSAKSSRSLPKVSPSTELFCRTACPNFCDDLCSDHLHQQHPLCLFWLWGDQRIQSIPNSVGESFLLTLTMVFGAGPW